MANATNTLQLTITSADQNGIIAINRGAGNPQLAGNVGELIVNQLLGNGDNIMFLPTPNTFNFYIKNNAANGSGQKVIVKITPNGGVQAILASLEPGGVFVWWNTINTDPPGSFTALTLNASVANIPVEYFLGG